MNSRLYDLLQAYALGAAVSLSFLRVRPGKAWRCAGASARPTAGLNGP